MRTPREVVHEALDGQCGPNWVKQSGHHDIRCDRLTAAIQARDEEHEAELARHIEGGQDALRFVSNDLNTARTALERIAVMVDEGGINSSDDVLAVGLIARNALATLDGAGK